MTALPQYGAIARRAAAYARLRRLLLLLRAATAACSADFPDLRGTFSNWSASSSYSRWDGLNFGGQFGVTNMDTDFGNSTSGLVAYILRNTEVEGQFSPSSWTTLPSNTTNGRQYGAFSVTIVQWDQLVVGFDVAYNRISTLSSSASDTIARQVVTTPDNVNNALTITTQSSLKTDRLCDDARTRRLCHRPVPALCLVGAAVGRFNYTSTATSRLRRLRRQSPNSVRSRKATTRTMHRRRLRSRARHGRGGAAECVPARRMGIVAFAPVNGI